VHVSLGFDSQRDAEAIHRCIPRTPVGGPSRAELDNGYLGPPSERRMQAASEATQELDVRPVPKWRAIRKRTP
jgi:hypothetical protein